MGITLYGIPNCDQVKKSRTWLEQHGQQHQFHDFKKAGLSEALVRQWMSLVSLEDLLNRKGTTWRKLPDERKTAVSDEARAIALMLEQPSIVKRPVLWIDGPEPQCRLGFSESAYRELLHPAAA